MNNKLYFRKYLEKHSSLALCTIKHYIYGITNLMDRLNIDLNTINTLTDIERVQQLLYDDEELMAESIKGHNIYTCPVKKYIDYIDSDFFSSNNVTKKPKSKSTTIEIWERDQALADDYKKEKGYKCECNNNHKTFKSNKTNQNYVEVHHLIPMKFQDDFGDSIDIKSNLICLCPNCHRLIHNGIPDERNLLIERLYNDRKAQLEKNGISISLETLIGYYDNDK